MAFAVGSVLITGGLVPAAAAVETPDGVPYDGPIHESTGDGTLEPGALEPSSDETRALSEAAETGQPVEVLSLRGEASEAWAQPSGSVEVREYVVPRWTRGEEGAWVRVDTALQKAADGTVAPVASTVNVAFSGGGDGPLVRMERMGRVLELSWPTTLPAPSLDGDTAVYADVIEGVDLQMTATEAGYSSHIVVKTAEAAASPDLDQIRFPMRADGLQVDVAASGSVEATDAGSDSVVFEAADPVMWDSAPADQPVAETARISSEAGDPGEDGPGHGPIAEVDVAVTPGGEALTLTPDQSLLEGPDTVYPVVIDPTWHTPKTGAWTSPNKSYPSTSYWQFKGEATAGLGMCTGWADCPGGSTYRLLYRFDTSRFNGTEIVSAELRVPNTHSAECTPRTVSVYRTKGITSSTSWNTQEASGFWIEKASEATFSYGGNQSGCVPAANAEFPMRTFMQKVADSRWDTVTLGLRAASETDKNHWKKMGRDAYLHVLYNRAPSKIPVSRLTMEYGGACSTSADAARVRTLGDMRVSSAYDPDGDDLRMEFLIERADGTNVYQSGLVPAAAKKNGSGFSVEIPGSVPENTLLRWLVRSYDGRNYSEWTRDSGFGCYFVYDTRVPRAPTINSTEYPESDPADPLDPWHDGVGEYGWFSITATTTDVVKLRYGINGNPTTANEIGSRSGTFPVLPTEPGVHFITARAFDAAGNPSEIVTYQYRVGSGRTPVGGWTFDEGGSAFALAGNAAVVAPDDAMQGQALELDGLRDYATTSAGRVNTSSHFAVEAWVKLRSFRDDMAIVMSQPGNHQQGFRLYYTGQDNKWMFSQHATDTAGSDMYRATNDAVPKLNTWTHLVGVHDAYRRTLRLYVNGKAGPSVKMDSAWNAQGQVILGSAKFGTDAPAYSPDGWIDGAKTYDRVLPSAEIAILARSKPAVASRWTFEKLDGSTPPNVTNAVAGKPVLRTATTGAPTTWGWVDFQALNLDGDGDYAATDLDVVPIRTGESFTVTGWASAVGSLPASGMTALSLTGSQEEALQVRVRPITTSEGEQAAVWELVLRDANGGGTTRKIVDESQPDASGWTHFAVTYDAQTATARLHLQGVSPEDTGSVGDALIFEQVRRLSVGRGLSSSTWDEYWAGAVDDVWLFRGVLDDHQINQLLNGLMDYPTQVPGSAG